MTCKRIATSLATTTALFLSLAFIAPSANAAEVVLSGSITVGRGPRRMEGVRFLPRRGSPITTTVFTDETGRPYYFPAARGRQYKSGRRR